MTCSTFQLKGEEETEAEVAESVDTYSFGVRSCGAAGPSAVWRGRLARFRPKG